jgi:hypothetical protein
MFGNSEAGPRARAFFIFALLLFGAGAATQLSGVKIWPWWLYGIGAFVLSQAALKWSDSVLRYCPKCHYRTNVWPWTKEQVESPFDAAQDRRKSEVGSEELVAVKQRFTGETIERALYRFEDQCSEENVDGVVVQERTERSDGVLVRYEVSWKHSVFDDVGYDSYVSWALLSPADPGVGDPADARFCVAAATAEHHNL